MYDSVHAYTQILYFKNSKLHKGLVLTLVFVSYRREDENI
jgi:hypothetical protein